MEKRLSFSNVNDAINYYRKSTVLYAKLGLKNKPDPWDAYINKGQLNIVCILKALQPHFGLLGTEFNFIGFPAPLRMEITDQKVLYVSMGTVLNGDVAFYSMCINVLREFRMNTILSVGSKVRIEELPSPPDYIHIVPFTNQVRVLEEAVMFISRGGMASIHEAIYTLTPMIVIPVIPEQRITAERIQELGIGIHIPSDQLSESCLQSAIQKM